MTWRVSSPAGGRASRLWAGLPYAESHNAADASALQAAVAEATFRQGKSRAHSRIHDLLAARCSDTPDCDSTRCASTKAVIAAPSKGANCPLHSAFLRHRSQSRRGGEGGEGGGRGAAGAENIRDDLRALRKLVAWASDAKRAVVRPR